MSSFLSSFKRSAVPIEDAPLDSLPEPESTALEALDARLRSLFDPRRSGLDETDPWRTLSDDERRQALLRFLRYQLLNVDKAEAHIKRVATWRASERPWNRTLKTLSGKKVGLPVMSPEAKGRHNEILIFLPSSQYIKAEVNHAGQELGIKTFFEYCAYATDGYRAHSGVLLIDFSELLMKNVDLITARNAIRVFLEYYPEVFSKILFVNYPRWMHGTWKCIAPLLDARSVAKVVWLPDGDALRAELAKYFTSEELPVWLGGTAQNGEIELFTGDKLDPAEWKARLFSGIITKS